MPDESYLDGFEIPEQDKETLSKKDYANIEAALIGAASHIRMAGSPDRVVKGLQKLKVDKLTDEQREQFHTSINRIRGIPAKMEDYQVDKAVLESPDFDKELFEGARQVFHKGRGSQALFNEALGWWNGLMAKRKQVLAENSQKVEAALRTELGDDANRILGDPNNEESIGTVKQALMQLSKELGFDYQDEEGNPKSHLFNELDADGKNGPLGDKPYLLKTIAHIHDKFLATGTTLPGTPPSGQKSTSQQQYEQNKKEFPNTPSMWGPKP